MAKDITIIPVSVNMKDSPEKFKSSKKMDLIAECQPTNKNSYQVMRLWLVIILVTLQTIWIMIKLL